MGGNRLAGGNRVQDGARRWRALYLGERPYDLRGVGECHQVCQKNFFSVTGAELRFLGRDRSSQR